MRPQINTHNHDGIGPGWQHRQRSENEKWYLLLRLNLLHIQLRTYLTAGIGIFPAAMPLLAAILSLLIGKEQAYAVAALKKENCGGKENGHDSSAAHDSK